MARSVNKVILIGNLTHDPESRTMPSGRPVCTFSIATNRLVKNEKGEREEKSDYHRIVAFGKLAEICGQYLKKGRKVYVAGRLANRSYEKDGEKRIQTEVIIDDMVLLDTKGEKITRVAPATEETSQPRTAEHIYEDGSYDTERLADEIPF